MHKLMPESKIKRARLERIRPHSQDERKGKRVQMFELNKMDKSVSDYQVESFTK